MLTDSGGFQVFSLEGLRRISEDGVEFQSHVDGTLRTLTPERAMEIQWALGADVAMAFDHVVPGQAPHELAREGMERRSAGWIGCKAEAAMRAERASADGRRRRGQPLADHAGRHPRRPPPPLARGHARARPLDRHRHRRALGRRAQAGDAPRAGGCSSPSCPAEIPRYLMGVGFPADLLEGIARGVDLFDCVAATRNGRHGTAWLPTGRVNVRGAALKGSTEPLDPECDCETCTTIRAATCGTCSWSRTCSGCGWSRCTTSASWFGSASRRARRSWPEPSTAGAATGSAATTRREHEETAMLQATVRLGRRNSRILLLQMAASAWSSTSSSFARSARPGRSTRSC